MMAADKHDAPNARIPKAPGASKPALQINRAASFVRHADCNVTLV